MSHMCACTALRTAVLLHTLGATLSTKGLQRALQNDDLENGLCKPPLLFSVHQHIPQQTNAIAGALQCEAGHGNEARHQHQRQVVLYACAAERCLRKALINATLTRRTDAHIAHPCSVLTSAATVARCSRRRLLRSSGTKEKLCKK